MLYEIRFFSAGLDSLDLVDFKNPIAFCIVEKDYVNMFVNQLKKLHLTMQIKEVDENGERYEIKSRKRKQS